MAIDSGEWLPGKRERIQMLEPGEVEAAQEQARLLFAQGDLAGARALQECVLATLAHVFGAEDTVVHIAAHNLASTIRGQGDLAGARVLQERVFAAFERVFGAEHPNTLAAAGNLAVTMHDEGDLSGARNIHERILLIHERMHGAKDPLTLTAVSNLASTIHTQGDLTGARVLQERVFESRKCVLGDEHPDTLTAESNLSATMRTLGDLTSARKLAKHVFDTRKSKYGEEHPHTLVAANNLAATMRDQNDLVGARVLQERVLDINERVLGAEHPLTLTAALELAATMRSQSDLAGARALDERVFVTHERVLGLEHHTTLTAGNNLSATMHAQGDYVGARVLLEVIFSSSARSLGAKHPTTLSIANNLAWTMRAQGDLASARRVDLTLLRTLDTIADVGNVVFRAAQKTVGKLLEDSAASETAPDWLAEVLDLLPQVSRNLQSHLEVRGADSTATVVDDYVRFHHYWLALCARWAPATTPRAVAPLHGLEAWSTALGALLNAESAGGLNKPQHTFLQARQALADIRARIAAVDAAIARLADNDAQRALTQLAQLRTRREALTQEERQGLARYQHARQTLQASDPVFAAAVRPLERSADDYTRVLPAGEALVIVCRIDDAAALAIVLGTGPRIATIPLPELTRFHAQVLQAHADERSSSQRAPTLRDYLDAEADGSPRMNSMTLPQPPSASADDFRPAYPVSTLSELRASAEQSFWASLQAAFPDVIRWQVVTGPGLHSLPLDLGRPAALAARYSCGLPAYWRLREQPLPLPALAGLEVAVDAAWATPAPIPFVEAELALLQRVLAATGAVQRLDAASLLAGHRRCPRVQLACHGRREGESGRAYGVLLLDGQVLDPVAAASLPGAIGEFFASACVGGVVASTQGGDALGLVAALQLRGVTAAIACLAPVPDFYMPLLVALYWHARVQGHAPPDALAQAKHALRAGDWPPALLAPIGDAYVDLMVEVLQRAQYASGSGAGTTDAHRGRGLTGFLNRLLARAPIAERPPFATGDALSLANSVRGWLLPDDVRARHFSAPQGMDAAHHRCFSADWCEDADRRRQLAHAVAQRLLDERRQWPAAARAAIESLCGYTVHFGV